MTILLAIVVAPVFSIGLYIIWDRYCDRPRMAAAMTTFLDRWPPLYQGDFLRECDEYGISNPPLALKFRDIVSVQLRVPLNVIDPRIPWREISRLGLDGHDPVDVVMALEKEFGLDLPDDDVREWKTIGDTILFVEKARS